MIPMIPHDPPEMGNLMNLKNPLKTKFEKIK